jgi:hypothetical protein
LPTKENKRPFPFAGNKRKFAVFIIHFPSTENKRKLLFYVSFVFHLHNSGNRDTRRHGDMEMETWEHGDMKALRRGDMEVCRHGNIETLTHGGTEAWRHGDMETWRHGHGDIKRKTENGSTGNFP